MLAVESKRINKNNVFNPQAVIYCFCVFEGCKKYKVSIPSFSDAKVEIIVTSAGEFQEKSHATQKLCRDLSGEQRKKVAEKLEAISASLYRSREINSVVKDESKFEKLKYGDIQTIKPLTTLRVAKSDSKSAIDFDKDPVQDLMKCLDKSLVSSVSFPLKIEVIKADFLVLLSAQKNTTLYFDATGSLMSKSNLMLFF